MANYYCWEPKVAVDGADIGPCQYATIIPATNVIPYGRQEFSGQLPSGYITVGNQAYVEIGLRSAPSLPTFKAGHNVASLKSLVIEGTEGGDPVISVPRGVLVTSHATRAEVRKGQVISWLVTFLALPSDEESSPFTVSFSD